MVSDRYGNVDYYYENFYSRIVGVETSGLSRLLSSYPHKLLEAPFKCNSGYTILELGSGANEHFPYVENSFDSYVAVDIKKPKIFPRHPRVHFVQGDIQSLPFEDSSFDRILATCILLHLNHPEKALLEMRRVIAENGFISIYLPTEPSIGLRFLRKIHTARKAKSLGYNGYDLFIARDHVTYFSRMIQLINYVFREDSVKYKFRPIPLGTWYFNAFCIVQIRVSAER